ncbi:putative zinc finger protein [Orchesella cincta]|uniref:Putative zinc finger protein n=1 Tax=Orchesella cincta TaxID=48709 RepID=A0A1D2MY70_ORCCI|nr:putative zinc finger protein [Orchesella cincta]
MNQCPFECNVAPRMEQHFMEHEAGDTEERKYECPDCKKKFKRYQYFEFHVTHFCGTLTWRCDICSVHIRRQDMNTHLAEVHAGRQATKICFRQQLLRHLHEDHGHNEIALVCNVDNCSATYYNTSMLARHKHIKHEQKRRKTYQCEHCPQEFSVKLSLSRHLIRDHNLLKYHCELCPERKFTEEKAFKCHLKMEHNIGDVEYLECKICSKKFLRRDRLRRHEIVHSDKREVTCDVCGFATKTKDMLRRHMFTHSTDTEKKHACTTWTTISEYTLWKVRDLWCCAFNQKGPLAGHMKRKHGITISSSNTLVKPQNIDKSNASTLTGPLKREDEDPDNLIS